jgi:hypothetical protein
MASHLFTTYTRTFARMGFLSLLAQQTAPKSDTSTVALRNSRLANRANLARLALSDADTMAPRPATPSSTSNSLGIALAHHRMKYASRA